MLYETHDLVIFGRMSDFMPKNCFYYLILFIFYQRGLYQCSAYNCVKRHLFLNVYSVAYILLFHWNSYWHESKGKVLKLFFCMLWSRTRGVAPLIINFGTHVDVLEASHHGQFRPRKITPVTIEEEVVWVPELVRMMWNKKNVLVFAGF